MSGGIIDCPYCGRKLQYCEWGIVGPGGKEKEPVICPYEDCKKVIFEEMTDGIFSSKKVIE
ncbi:TPA: hypothetical protein OT801_003249 [Morganella morganii]|uniref:hypothetical protein n=1 Tax=Morganella morganii TaxID=582 RepID=UPI001BDACD00|nr:hypothetical protein [Morganella morganii]EHZ6678969.1 hypothetical protein [Morganella morganii]EKU8062032.1 hypothetical protein [Morganella morganii]ELB1288671.1 hypothetical protein [Morganella morganii]MBT0437800.1 hypothetical protein [Morganella morganii subsp. morganii]HCT7709156.1 hypothetical protein [Morganella morganii]